ncbi:unnamed protein product [Knipowitschia caucasica]
MAAVERNMVQIKEHMKRTFALRREEIVATSPPVTALKERWPGLFHESQLYSEFLWITNENLPHLFYGSLDKYAPKLIELYKKKRSGPWGEKMEQLLTVYEQEKNDINVIRTVALSGLIIHLKEDSSDLFRICKDEMDFQEGTVALVAMADDVPGGVPFSTQQVFIVLEDQVVMSSTSWTDALVCLFGLIYALHLRYPEKCIGFFEFIQVILLKLHNDRRQLKSKLQSLQNVLNE